MDNDVFGTDYCIGFSTAVSRSVEAINALRTTVESHERIGVVELFGRRSGETGPARRLPRQVDRTIIAEVPADLDRLLPLLAEDRPATRRAKRCASSPKAPAIAGDAQEDDSIRPPRSDRDAGVGTAASAGRSAPASAADAAVVQELAYLMRAAEP
jgi:6-phosphofructokinase 1